MKLTTKGQVTIPAEIREKYGFFPNTSIIFKEENGKVYIEKDLSSYAAEKNPFELVRGKADLKLSTDEIMEMTRGDGE